MYFNLFRPTKEKDNEVFEIWRHPSTRTHTFCLKMPASASTYGESVELTRHNSLEDQRALQVALELSLLSFGNVDHHHHGSTSPNHYHTTMDQIASLHYADEMRFLAKKSQNMTECVPVPSSEHVAEIVGRQGNYNHSHISSLCVLSSCVCVAIGYLFSC